MRVYIYIYVRVCMAVCMCIYIYIYICMHTYTYVHTCTHMHTSRYVDLAVRSSMFFVRGTLSLNPKSPEPLGFWV